VEGATAAPLKSLFFAGVGHQTQTTFFVTCDQHGAGVLVKIDESKCVLVARRRRLATRSESSDTAESRTDTASPTDADVERLNLALLLEDVFYSVVL
jgi:hypothetical protein